MSKSVFDLNAITLNDLINKYAPDAPQQENLFLKELVLWGLVEFDKLKKQRLAKGFSFKDQYSAYLSGL